MTVGKRKLSIDLGAEKALIGAERDSRKIAIEIKTFGSPSPVADLQQAIGQFAMYKTVLARAQPERELYLAVSVEVRDSLFSEELGKWMAEEYLQRLFYFSVETEEIIEWRP